MTTLHDFGGVLGQPLDTFFWARSHIYMVTVPGSCVKWPLEYVQDVSILHPTIIIIFTIFLFKERKIWRG